MLTVNPYQNYLEAEVTSAEPLRLVQMLYRGALDAIDDARGYLRSGNIAARSASIIKAIAILQELIGSLNFEAGGELSRNLAEIYDYAQKRLLDANIRQADEPLAEVQCLLAPLLEAWDACIPELV
jgi:flagellar protein FliS